MNDDTTARHRRWQIPAAAAAVLVLGVGGYAIAQSNDGAAPSQPVAAAKPMKLSTAAPGPGSAACIIFTPAILAQKPVAFSGTVAKITKASVLLDVDHWYRGGHARQVEITSPGHTQISVEGGVSWKAGTRYLVTATDGIVNGCGYTTPWTAHGAAVFAKAFH